MARPRNHTNGDLPRYLHRKHGAVYYVRNGKWHRLADNVADAIGELAKMMGSKVGATAAPTPALSTAMMMSDLINTAFPDICIGLQKTTTRRWRTAANQLCVAFDDLTVPQFDITKVYDIRRGLKKHPSKFNHLLTVLRLVIQWAKEKGIKVESVAEVTHLEQNQRDRYITDAEYNAIYNEASDLCQAIMELAYRTAQRINDVLTIQITQLTDEGIAFKQSKTDAKLVIGWTPELRAAVARVKALTGGEVSGNVVRMNPYLIAGRGRAHIAYTNLRRHWLAARKASGVADVVIHDLRAKAATDVYLANGGGQIGGAGVAAAQALLGHATPTMTWRYIRSRLSNVVQGPTARAKAGK